MGNGFVGWFARSYKVIIVVLVAIMAASLVTLAMQNVSNSRAVAAGETASPIPAFSSAPRLVKVSILSDSHAYNADSWWRQTVVARQVPGVELGKFDSTPGADTARLAADAADSASDGGWVVVQAGTNDLLTGKSPEQTVQGLTTLWDSVASSGGKPIAALVPPSNERPTEVVRLNQLITDAASEKGLPLLDVYTTVAAADGSWAGGHTSDGRHADSAASKTMADAALAQLPGLVAD